MKSEIGQMKLSQDINDTKGNVSRDRFMYAFIP